MVHILNQSIWVSVKQLLHLWTFRVFFARLAQNISKTIPMSDTLGIKEIEKEAKFPKYILFVHSSLSHQRVAGVCAL